MNAAQGPVDGVAAAAIRAFSGALVTEIQARIQEIRQDGFRAVSAGNADHARHLNAVADALAHMSGVIEVAAHRSVVQ